MKSPDFVVRSGGALRGLARGRGGVLRGCARCRLIGRLRSRRCRLGACGQISDDVGAVMIGFEPGERHLVAGNKLLRIGKIGIQSIAVPDEAALLHRRRVIVARLGARLTAHDAGERRTQQVLAGVH